MLNWLKQPYPLMSNWHTSLQSGLMAGGVVAAFLYLFRPFGTTVRSGRELQYLFICLLFGAVTLLCSLVWGALKRLFKYDEVRWTVGKSILDTLGLVLLIGVGNWALSTVLSGRPPDWSTLGRWQMMTFLVAFAPITVGFLLSYWTLMRKYTDMATQTSLALAQRSTHEADEKPIVLEGDNRDDKLHIAPDDLLALTSADNYVEVWYLSDSILKRVLLRSTLKRMEDALIDHPQFLRCHRTVIVNLDAVQEVSGNAQGLRLHINDLPTPLPVSRQRSGDQRLLAYKR